MFRRSPLKSRAQLGRMVEAGTITRLALEAARNAIVPGATTSDIDRAAERVIADHGATANFKLVRGYRHASCVSVNDEVVHGIPGGRVIAPGDIVKVDCGAETPSGWNGDSAITVVVPDDSRPDLVAERTQLSERTEYAMWAGIAALASAGDLGDVSAAIEDAINDHPLERTGEPAGILRDYVGHGIGRKMHEAPSLFNYRHDGDDARVRPGLAMCVEPMTTGGASAVYVADDGWTIITRDGSDGSHWEHSVAVHDEGIWVLTAADGGAAGLSPFGVAPVPIS